MRLLSTASFSTVILVALAGTNFAKANDVYIAQSAAGVSNGSSCANSLAYTYFNTPANWIAGTPSATQIGPGTTVHLCGTFTAPPGSSEYLVFQRSGTVGNPIMLLFEPGAILTTTYWSGPAIDIGSNSYATINGGTNGTIRATANGTGLANQQNNGEGVAAAHGANESNIIVENLTISNLYVHTCTLPISNCTDEGGQDTYGIDVWDVSNLTIANNTITNTKWGIRYSFGSSAYSNVVISNNVIGYVDHGVFATPGNSAGTFNGPLNVNNNSVTHMEVWDESADSNHHDCFHLNSVAGSNFNGISVYNNSCITDPGVNGNTGIFISPDSGSMGAVKIFNNIIDSSLSSTNFYANCAVGVGLINNALIVNNTLVQPNVSGSGGTKPCAILLNSGTGHTMQNNIIVYSALPEWFTLNGEASVASVDYNDFYSIPASGGWQMPTSTFHYPLTSWVSASGYDSHSITSNPSLNSSYTPGSSAVNMGANLTSLGITALDSDKAGNPRPSSGPWYMGAYQVANVPNTISGLTATVQ